jgi:hypothetical protein
MYANREKVEYEALVARVRGHFGSGVEVGGYNSHDILKLRSLDAQREAEQARAAEARPINEAATRLHHTYRRSMAAWRTITEKQEYLSKNRRLHFLNGISPALLEPVEQPAPAESFRTADEYDAANAEASILATELETRAQKITSYVGGWEQSTPDQRNLSLILVLADRLERLKTGEVQTALGQKQ